MSPSTEADILRLAQERSDALVRKDLSTLERILALHFVYTNASGEVLDRATYLDRYVRSSDVRWEEQRLEDVTVRVSGSAAILTCRVRDLAWFGETRLDARFQSTFTFAYLDSGWQCIAGHTGASAPAEIG
jgi:hypothetical protein